MLTHVGLEPKNANIHGLKVHVVVLGEEILMGGERSSSTDLFPCLNKLNGQTLFVFMTE